MKYYIIAGEASGDLHGSNLIKELRKKDANAVIRCWGGELMRDAGGQLVKHYKDLAFMGFLEVVRNLHIILRNLRFCKADILDFQPSVLVLIDYPGFNLRIAEWAKKQGTKVIYYISPQVWAWKESRVKLIKECVDKMLVILPFEKEFYQKWNFEVEYVGHPLVEVVEKEMAKAGSERMSEKKIVALLPGSRKQEIMKKLPLMFQMAKFFPDFEFIVAKAPGINDEFYENLLTTVQGISSVRNATYPLLKQATAALVTSGTATLETALFDVPQVVCYKGSNISYQIAKRLVKIKYISLVNLIMDKPVIKELIQDQLTVENLKIELQKILSDPFTVQRIKTDYTTLKGLLKRDGKASEKAAESIVSFIT